MMVICSWVAFWIVKSDAAGRCSLLEISARGDSLTVKLNGQTTVDAVRNAAHAEGPIALQYGSGSVKFRRVDIRVA